MGEYQKLSDAYLSDAYYKRYILYKKNNEYTYKEIEDYVFDDKYSFKEIKDQRISDSDCRTSSEEEKQKALERLMQG